MADHVCLKMKKSDKSRRRKTNKRRESKKKDSRLITRNRSEFRFHEDNNFCRFGVSGEGLR